MSKFNDLTGGSVLGDRSYSLDGLHNLDLPKPIVNVDLEAGAYIIGFGNGFIKPRDLLRPVDGYFAQERQIRKSLAFDQIDTPLSRVYDLNISGAKPYFCLVVGFLLAVGGWFWWLIGK